MDTGSDSASQEAPDKLAYETPRLSRFGNVSELTQAVGSMGAMDGGPMGADMTGL